MKILLAYLLSIIVFLASSPNSLMLVDYHCNRDFYEELCVNKDKPEMDCHGKCEVKKESEQSSSPIKLLKTSFEFNILPISTVEIPTPKKFDFTKNSNNFFTNILKIQQGFYMILPHPPQI